MMHDANKAFALSTNLILHGEKFVARCAPQYAKERMKPELFAFCSKLLKILVDNLIGLRQRIDNLIES